MNTKQITLTGLMAAVLCILGPLSLPIPISPVPISLGMFGVYLTVYILGLMRGTISVCIYILLGLVGLPVFTGFAGGIGKVAGPTGGYIVGYIFMSLIIGFAVDKWDDNYLIKAGGMLVGTAVCYLFGTLWLAKQAAMSFSAALWAGVIPFIPGDLIKLAVAVLVGEQVRRRLLRAGILEKSSRFGRRDEKSIQKSS